MSNINLELKQLQKLVMTTELKQAIDLLTMPVLEFQQFVREQLESNPVLEENESSASGEDELLAYLREGSGAGSQSYVINREDPPAFEAKTDVFNNLYEYLFFQLNILPLSERQKKIGKYILYQIDDNGYLLKLPGTIAAELRLPAAEVAEVLDMIHRFDPLGVGCINLKECMILQLDRNDPYYDALKQIVNEYLDMVASNRVPQIAKQMKLPVEVVNGLVNQLRSLDPRPGRSWGGGSDEIEYITPDVTVRKIEGEWAILLNEWDVPQILVSDYYQNLIKTGMQLDENTTEYLKDKLHAAFWVLKSIEQRRKTIHDTVKAVLKFQAKFFDAAAEYPVPLNLKTVAEEIGVHESTISRAVSNKYLQTPRGLFSFKYFFPKGLSTGSDENTLGIKKQLKDLIDSEDGAHPYKDGELEQLLKDRGVNISRRTVAKYREQLNIPIAGKRKTF